MIIERKTNTVRNNVVDLVKVHWQHQKGFEWTCKLEEEMMEHYPVLVVAADFEDEV